MCADFTCYLYRRTSGDEMSDPLDVANWNVCDIHEESFYRDSFCKDCRIDDLEQTIREISELPEKWLRQCEDSSNAWMAVQAEGGHVPVCFEAQNETKKALANKLKTILEKAE